jgi:hypothetical protein
VLIFIGTCIVDFFLTAFLIGATAFLLFGQSGSNGRNKKAIVFIFAITVFSDLMYYLTLSILDLDIIIGNPEIADLLGPTGLNNILTFQLYDPVVWIVQTVLAYMIGKMVYRKISETRPESASGV